MCDVLCARGITLLRHPQQRFARAARAARIMAPHVPEPL
jgi:hypothetical protein